MSIIYQTQVASTLASAPNEVKPPGLAGNLKILANKVVTLHARLEHILATHRGAQPAVALEPASPDNIKDTVAMLVSDLQVAHKKLDELEELL